MKRNIFFEQSIPLLLEGVPEGRGSDRDKSSVKQLAPHCDLRPYVGRLANRSVSAITVILLVLSVLATACSKPEKKELAGTWRWVATTGGIGGWYYTPESEGFEAEIVFKGSQFTFYKDGKKVTSGTYRIDYDEDETYYIGNKPFYSRFRFHISGAQVKKISEATNGTISFFMKPTGLIGYIGYSEAEGQVFSLCDDVCDGFCHNFVKNEK